MANIANMAFTYGGHGTFPEQVREMKDPNDFFRGFDILYGVAMPFYTVCALVSFWAFGNMNSANYIENLMDNNIVKVNLYLSLLSGLPIIVLGQVVILLQLEIPAGILPTDWWVNRSQNEGRLATFLRSTKLSPVMIRFFFRTFYIGVLLLLAEMLDDAGLGTIVSISGAIGLAAMTYWLPFVLALKLDWEEVRTAHHCESRNVTFFSPNHISPLPVQEQAGPGRMLQPPCARWHFHQRDGRSIQRDRPG